MTPTATANKQWRIKTIGDCTLNRRLNVLTGDVNALHDVFMSVKNGITPYKGAYPYTKLLPITTNSIANPHDRYFYIMDLNGSNCPIPDISKVDTSSIPAMDFYVINSIETNMPPKMQQTILTTLLKLLPRTQLIVCTMSPLVIGSVKPKYVWTVTKDFEFSHPVRSYGLNSDEIYSEILGVDEGTYAPDFNQALHEINSALADNHPEKAKELLDKLEKEVGTVPAILGLRTHLAMFEGLGQE